MRRIEDSGVPKLKFKFGTPGVDNMDGEALLNQPSSRSKIQTKVGLIQD
jgi:hypothetical protein